MRITIFVFAKRVSKPPPCFRGDLNPWIELATKSDLILTVMTLRHRGHKNAPHKKKVDSHSRPLEEGGRLRRWSSFMSSAARAKRSPRSRRWVPPRGRRDKHCPESTRIWVAFTVSRIAITKKLQAQIIPHSFKSFSPRFTFFVCWMSHFSVTNSTHFTIYLREW